VLGVAHDRSPQRDVSSRRRSGSSAITCGFCRARNHGAMRKLMTFALLSIACIARAQPATAPALPDYAKRATGLAPSLQSRLVGRWTNPGDHVVVDITSIDLASGRLAGKELAPGSASAQIHELVGWVNDAPSRQDFDHVVPVTFTTTLHEYGTLPVWAGFLRGDELVTLHYLVWPNRTYPWDHVTTGQETWTKLPEAGEWRPWTRDRKLAYMRTRGERSRRTIRPLGALLISPRARTVADSSGSRDQARRSNHDRLDQLQALAWVHATSRLEMARRC
jgi:hypothetical protein